MQLKRGCRLWWLVVPALAADRITKCLAKAALAPRGVRSVVKGALSWAYTENRGAAFSILSGRNMLLILMTLALISALLIHLLRHPENPSLERAGLWFIIAGGLGNLWDRLSFGCVIDFIRLDFVNFAIFNAADIFVCGGAVAVALSVLITEWRKKKHA